MKKEELEKENEVKTFEIEELRNLINKLDGVIKKMEAETIDQKNQLLRAQLEARRAPPLGKSDNDEQI